MQYTSMGWFGNVCSINTLKVWWLASALGNGGIANHELLSRAAE
jgi:hypothetical protein